jgi:hypothetical protein
VQRPERIVQELLGIDRESCQRFFAGIVPRIGLGDDKSGTEGSVSVQDAVWRFQIFSRVAAISEHVQPPVPFCGKADFDSDLRLNLDQSPAELRIRGVAFTGSAAMTENS